MMYFPLKRKLTDSVFNLSFSFEVSKLFWCMICITELSLYDQHKNTNKSSKWKMCWFLNALLLFTHSKNIYKKIQKCKNNVSEINYNYYIYFCWIVFLSTSKGSSCLHSMCEHTVCGFALHGFWFIQFAPFDYSFLMSVKEMIHFSFVKSRNCDSLKLFKRVGPTSRSWCQTRGSRKIECSVQSACPTHWPSYHSPDNTNTHIRINRHTQAHKENTVVLQ